MTKSMIIFFFFCVVFTKKVFFTGNINEQLKRTYVPGIIDLIEEVRFMGIYLNPGNLWL